MSKCGSTANLDADTVFDACEQYLTARVKRIEREREALIEEKMNARKYYLFGRKITREEAIERCKDDGFIPEWTQIAISGNYWATRILDLQHLAALAKPGIVSVDEELARILYQFWPDTKTEYVSNEAS